MLKTNTNQERLQEVVHILFPCYNIKVNAQKAGHVYSEERRRYLELDVWVPELNLAFEYQDPHHYSTTWYGNAPISDVNYRDNIKHSQVTSRGATLVTVPCWWDGAVDSLAATIQLQRDDLLREVRIDAAPIPAHPPENFFRAPTVPGVGELMLAYFPTNAEQFSNTTWWTSEKYDGVRACWNMSDLYSRYGTKFQLTDSVASSFPKSSLLDGEIWFGRGNFHERHNSATPDGDEPTKFDNSLYVVFDEPTNDISIEFESRYSTILNAIPHDHPFITIAPCCQCSTMETRLELLESVTSEHGEGLVLRRIKSEYSPGRSESLLKCKVLRDLDALVLESNADVAVCRLQLPDGTTTQAYLEQPFLDLNIGDVVSFQFEDFDKSGKPWGARVIRVRDDMSWVDALQAPRQNTINDVTELTFQLPKEVKPRGYWTVEGLENTRRFFDDYAKAHGFDPLVAENWYSITRQKVLAFRPHENGPLVMRKDNRNLQKLLLEAYPDIGLVEAKFERLARNYWIHNQRSVLENYANRNNFDPLVPENWYSVSIGDVLSSKGAKIVRNLYGTFQETLVKVFPEVHFVVENFLTTPRNYWSSWDNKKKFFDTIAKRDNFDPLVAENWYSFKKSEFLLTPGISAHYNNSIVAALSDVYPTLVLDPSRFFFIPQNFYDNTENQRAFFENVAKKHNFDPLIAENWYNLGAAKITNERGGNHVLSYFSSYPAAIQHSFPEIKIEAHKFRIVPQSHWKSKENVRQLLLEVASKLGFDPLQVENWYPVRLEQIEKYPKVRSALDMYKMRLADALRDTFPELSFDRSKFSAMVGYWSSSENRRIFLTRYAEKNGFDPLIASNWYSLSLSHFRKEKRAAGLINHLSDKKMLLSEAVRESFPELKLDMSLFWKSKSKKFKKV